MHVCVCGMNIKGSGAVAGDVGERLEHPYARGAVRKPAGRDGCHKRVQDKSLPRQGAHPVPPPPPPPSSPSPLKTSASVIVLGYGLACLLSVYFYFDRVLSPNILRVRLAVGYISVTGALLLRDGIAHWVKFMFYFSFKSGFRDNK